MSNNERDKFLRYFDRLSPKHRRAVLVLMFGLLGSERKSRRKTRARQ